MKPWWRSKTIWVAVLMGLIAGLNAAAEVLSDARAISVIGVVAAVLFVILRAVTDEPVTWSRNRSV